MRGFVQTFPLTKLPPYSIMPIDERTNRNMDNMRGNGMKFTNGYWLYRDEYQVDFATDLYEGELRDGALKLLVASKPIHGRGDILNIAALTVEVTSPMENVIRVAVTHHKGRVDAQPALPLETEPVAPTLSQSDGRFALQSGELTAETSRSGEPWCLRFHAQGRPLTQTGFRAMAHVCEKHTGAPYMIEQLDLAPGETVYGLGERFTAYVKNGQVVDNWNCDGGTASEQAYKSIPFYMTNRGYGVLVESSGDVSFEVASEKVERVQFSLPGERLVYTVVYGKTPKDILERYTALTGRPPMVPAWSFGLWLTTSFTTAYDEATVTGQLIDEMARRDVPLHVFHFDCYWMKGFRWCDFVWDRDTFPDPQGMLARLKQRGLRICVWINPYIAQNSALFDDMMEKGYLLTTADGKVWQTDLWQAGMGILDVTNPAAVAYFQGFLSALCDMGVDCFKTDFGERIPVRGVKYFDGSDPRLMHNHYTYLYNRLVYDVLVAKRGEGEAILFARSASIGSQRFPAHWGGDNSANYSSMAETLRGGLSLAHTGFAYWSHDISGFEQTASPDVYKRWLAFGLLSSHSRLHGSESYRAPWLFGDEAVDVCRHFVKLKCRLMPYLYEKAYQAHDRGTPVLRPMMLEFPDDPTCDYTDMQYMLGDDLLVAPVFNTEGTARYYLPKGRWTHLLSGEVTEGGGWHQDPFDYFSLPLMVRENAVIPMGQTDTKPDYDYLEGLTLHWYQPKDVQQVRIVGVDRQVQEVFTLRYRNGQAELSSQNGHAATVVVHA